MKRVAPCLWVLFVACSAQVVFPSDGDTADAASTSEVTAADEALREAASVDLRRGSLGFGSSCRTPSGEFGTCLQLQSCGSYRPLYGALHARGVLAFLRERLCSVTPRTAFICCPSSGSPILPNSQPPRTGSSSRIPARTVCGRPSVERVIGGTTVPVGAWPWLAVIGLNRGQEFVASCGGTLITERHVLTAAHCFDPRYPLPTTVRLGEHNLLTTNDNADPQDFGIATRRSPGYNTVTHENDIEILVLDRPVAYNELIRPACLPFNDRTNNFENTALTVAGWGRTSTTSLRTSSVPMQADVPVVDTATCARAYDRVESKPVVDHRHICAGDGKTDSCGGDSGGPLVYLGRDGRYYVVGIVSFAVDCARRDFPGVYTKVGSYLNWIQSTVEST